MNTDKEKKIQKPDFNFGFIRVYPCSFVDNFLRVFSREKLK